MINDSVTQDSDNELIVCVESCTRHYFLQLVLTTTTNLIKSHWLQLIRILITSRKNSQQTNPNLKIIRTLCSLNNKNIQLTKCTSLIYYHLRLLAAFNNIQRRISDSTSMYVFEIGKTILVCVSKYIQEVLSESRRQAD